MIHPNLIVAFFLHFVLPCDKPHYYGIDLKNAVVHELVEETNIINQ